MLYAYVTAPTGGNWLVSVYRPSDQTWFDWGSTPAFLTSGWQTKLQQLAEGAAEEAGGYAFLRASTPSNIFLNDDYIVRYHDGNAGNQVKASVASYCYGGTFRSPLFGTLDPTAFANIPGGVKSDGTPVDMHQIIEVMGAMCGFGNITGLAAIPPYTVTVRNGNNSVILVQYNVDAFGNRTIALSPTPP